MLTAVLVAIAGCSNDVPELVVEQERVRVEQLGAVEPPAVHRIDGENVEGIVWTVESTDARGSVARVEDGKVVAIEAGEAQVVGHWHGQEVRWHLEVAPTIVLRFVDPPAEIAVGESRTLVVVAERSGDAPIDPGDAPPIRGLSFEASPKDVLKVNDDGELSGVGAGTGYVTARTNGSRSVVEIHVVD